MIGPLMFGDFGHHLFKQFNFFGGIRGSLVLLFNSVIIRREVGRHFICSGIMRFQKKHNFIRSEFRSVLAIFRSIGQVYPGVERFRVPLPNLQAAATSTAGLSVPANVPSTRRFVLVVFRSVHDDWTYLNYTRKTVSLPEIINETWFGVNCQNQGRWYNYAMDSVQEFHPEQISRKGERNAWILTGVSIAAYLLLWRISEPSVLLLVMVIFLIISAFIISLSNWIDRKTTLILSTEGINFNNVLRSVHMNWDEIEQIQVLPDHWGKRVLVFGDQAHIRFRTLSDVEFRGKVRGQIGFHDGEAILEQIIRYSGLISTENENQGHYYVRP